MRVMLEHSRTHVPHKCLNRSEGERRARHVSDKRMPKVVKADPSQASGFRKAVPSAAPVLLVLCWVVS
jgi:hypothetical protein